MATLRTYSIDTTDTYQPVVAPPGTTGAVIAIANAGVTMCTGPGTWADTSGRLETPDAAAIRWSFEEQLLPIVHYIDDEPMRGLRFKSRAVGVPAHIDVTFTG